MSRATLLTGRYPQRIKLNVQLPGIEGNDGIGLRHSERLIPAYLKAAGYATGRFGKWNIGFAPGSRPTERGFDEFIGIASGTRCAAHRRVGLPCGWWPVEIVRA